MAAIAMPTRPAIAVQNGVDVTASANWPSSPARATNNSNGIRETATIGTRDRRWWYAERVACLPSPPAQRLGSRSRRAEPVDSDQPPTKRAKRISASNSVRNIRVVAAAHTATRSSPPETNPSA